MDIIELNHNEVIQVSGGVFAELFYLSCGFLGSGLVYLYYHTDGFQELGGYVLGDKSLLGFAVSKISAAAKFYEGSDGDSRKHSMRCISVACWVMGGGLVGAGVGAVSHWLFFCSGSRCQ